MRFEADWTDDNSVYSLNAVVPHAAIERRDELHEVLEPFEERRDPLTLVVKRFGSRAPTELDSLTQSLGEILQQWGPIAAEIEGIDVFVDPPGGPGPVVYLDITSPGLESLHQQLVDRFGVVDPTIEGHRYVPHITLARGGARTGIDSVTNTTISTHEWTIEELMLWSARHDTAVTRFSLPYRP